MFVVILRGNIERFGVRAFLRIGIFHSTLNLPGGAEFVTINMINALKQHGYRVVILTNEKIDQVKIKKIFGKTVSADTEIVLPEIFNPYSWSPDSIYCNAVQSLISKTKCNILIDTRSNILLPWTDIAYIHYPCIPGLLGSISHMRNALLLPYYSLVRKAKDQIDSGRKVVFANSRFVAKTILETLGFQSCILYPPVSMFLDPRKPVVNQSRKDVVVTVSRLSEGKNLEIIPYIAKLTKKNIHFVIIGRYQSEKVVYSVLKLGKELDVSERIKVLANTRRDQLKAILLNGKVYLHTMKNEHFGISIVEAMSSGCIPIVHDSGGPREFVPEHFRYKNIEEAAMKIERAISEWSPKHAERMLSIANKFNEREFSKKFLGILNPYVKGKLG